MTERVLGPTGGRRRKRLALLVPMAAIAALILAIGASAGPIGQAAGFEDDDGNLNPGDVIVTPPQTSPNFDWNSFALTPGAGDTALAWTGTTPDRVGSAVRSGWQFKGFEDAQETTSDDSFAGGVKQDDECASVIEHKANNKEDLKRIYLSSKTGTNGHTYLMLAWVRIPQNSTSNSANVAFEFNRGDTPCGTDSNGLVERSVDSLAGAADNSDMLIVYDFESGGTPVLRLERWIDSGTCEISSDSPPCWGVATNLTAGGFAEGKVNTASTALDNIGPDDPENLGLVEFGEAGIDLTAAGVFTAGSCETFGKAYGVSRTSGNSAQAQMKDLVGPGDFLLTNCGEIKIIKRTDPRGINQSFGFTSDINNSSTATCTLDTLPAAFSLNDSGNTSSDNAANTEDCTNVGAGTYNVDEDAPPAGFGFKSLTCTASGTGTSVTPTSSTSDDSPVITLAGGGVVTCIYVNERLTGALTVTKTGKDKSCVEPLPARCSAVGVAKLSGATFEIWKETNGTAGLQTSGGTPDTNVTSGSTGSDGTKCFDGLLFAGYYARETAAPTGYAIDGAVSALKTINASGACPSTGTVLSASFTNTPLSQIRVTFHSKAGVGVTTATIQCSGNPDLVPADDAAPSNLPDNSTGRLLDDLPPGTYDCQVVVDP